MREKILKTSLNQLNEFGIKQTSFRSIASQLAISDGHVRYYFKKKEDLLVSIFEQMNQEIISLAQKSQENEEHDIKAQLKKNLVEAFSVMANYSFFFLESPKTLNQFPKLATSYKSLLLSRKELFLSTFKHLKNMGFFKDTFTADKQEHAFFSIFIISDSWIRYHILLHNQLPDKDAILFHSNLAFNILVPFIRDDIN